jgi:hypothetical protein
MAYRTEFRRYKTGQFKDRIKVVEICQANGPWGPIQESLNTLVRSRAEQFDEYDEKYVLEKWDMHNKPNKHLPHVRQLRKRGRARTPLLCERCGAEIRKGQS